MSNFDSSSFAVPQHPLPEEIQQMNRDETVCKFCGVSYLIHNEVKALQEKLAEAEKQMEYYKGSVEREKVLKGKMEKMDAEFLEQSKKLKDQDQQLELFKSDLKMKAKLINDMYLQKRQYESAIQEEQGKSEKLSARISQLTSLLPNFNNLVRQQKDSLNSLRKDVIENKMSSKKLLLYFGGDVEKVTERLKKKVQQERKDAEMKWRKINEQLLDCQNELNNLRQADTRLGDLQRKNIDMKNKLDVYEKCVTQLEEGAKTLKEKNTATENELMQKSVEERRVKNSLEIVENEKRAEHLKYEELLTKKDEELKKLNALCKSLEKLMNEKSAAEKEVREKVTDKDAQLKNLEERVSEMRVESGKLKMEREQTIFSHHNRIEQLRESYVKKLEASEQSCRTLQSELDGLQHKAEIDFDGAQRSLKEEFEKEIKTLNVKHSEEVDNMENQIKALKDKLEQERRAFHTVKEEINQLKNTLSTNKTKNVQEGQKYQNEILDLRRSLEALQLEQNKTEGERENSNELTLLKSKHQTMQKALQDTKAQIKVMEQKLAAKNSEMSVLQDTVRRECEERLELTQALSDTRMQLLSLQRNPDAPRQFQSSKRLTNRPTVNNADLKTSLKTSVSDDMTSSQTSEIIASRVRRIKSTGSENPMATRESVDSFRERIAAALGRESRFNHTR